MSGIKVNVITGTILNQRKLLDILKDLINKVESGEVSIESFEMYISTDVSRCLPNCYESSLEITYTKCKKGGYIE